MLVSIPVEWIVLIGFAIPVAIFMVRRRDAQSSTLTESKVLTDKTVDNVKELWEKRDDLRDDMADVRERLARIEGAHDAEQRLQKSRKDS
ncbi:MAG: hypothetical protein QGD90_00245 [Candidatus Hydrogenedentes bacterium]|nr:hypothetical protein [Candidatus Hydrogenedentota bacterium]